MCPCLPHCNSKSINSNSKRRNSHDVRWYGLGEALPGVAAGLGTVVGGIVGIGVTILLGKWQIVGARNQAVHEERLKAYPKLVRATASLAIYFPDARQHVPIGPRNCADMGSKLTAWYFEEGGLLLSRNSKSAYFRLATALMRASRADSLYVPKLEDYGLFPNKNEPDRYLSKYKLDKYRTCLENHYNLKLRTDKERKKGEPDIVDEWSFGAKDLTCKKHNDSSPDFQVCSDKTICDLSVQFKDYIFLQTLSSDLRTKLTDDINSRKAPDGSNRRKSWLRATRRNENVFLFQFFS